MGFQANSMKNENTYIPPILSMTQMARLLNLSRSRFYQLINEEVLLPPIYSLDNRRPHYTEQMARRNLEVRRSNVGINGRIIIFYGARNKSQKITPRKTTVKEKPSNQSPNHHADLIDSLKGLGLENITASQIEAAITKCYPDGTENIDKDEKLRTIFRHLKRRNKEHNQRT